MFVTVIFKILIDIVMPRRSFTIVCGKCKTTYRVSETGTRFPWEDNEEYFCPVCKESGGSIKTHYNLDEIVIKQEGKTDKS